MNSSALEKNIAMNCTDVYREDTYLTGYTIFELTLSVLIIIANVLLITIILKTKALRTQVN